MFFIVAVNIPPDANSKNALQELYEVISSHMTEQPDGIFIVAPICFNWIPHPESLDESEGPIQSLVKFVDDTTIIG